MKKSIIFLLIMLMTSIVAHAQDTAQSKVTKNYWSKDKTKCAGCDSLVAEGVEYFIFRTPKFDLVFSGNHNTKLIFSTVYLINKSDERIEFDPRLSLIAVYKKRDSQNPVEYMALSPEAATKKMKGNKGFMNFVTALSGAMAQRTYTVDSTSSGTVSANDSRGNSGSGVYNEQSTSTINVPDVDAQRNAKNAIDERNRKASETENYYLSSALRANTIFSGMDVVGNIYFEKRKGEFMWLVIRIGDEYYIKGFNVPK